MDGVRQDDQLPIPLLLGPRVWHSRMQGRPVNELLDVPVERPTVDQLKIEVGRTKKDRVVTRLTGDHGKDGRLDSVDEAGDHQTPGSSTGCRNLGVVFKAFD